MFLMFSFSCTKLNAFPPPSLHKNDVICSWCTYYKDYVPSFPSQVKYLVLLIYLHILYNYLESDYYCVLHHGTYKALVMYTNNECAIVRVMAKAVLNKLLPGSCLSVSLSSDEASALIHHLVIQLTHLLLSQYKNSAEKELSILNILGEFVLTNENYQVLCSAAEKIIENSTSPVSENTGTGNTETENAKAKKTETGCTETENAATKLMWIIANYGTTTSHTNESVLELISRKQKGAGFHKIVLDLQQAIASRNDSVIRKLVHILINLAAHPENRLILTNEGAVDALREIVTEIEGMEGQLAARAISLIMELHDVNTPAGMITMVLDLLHALLC